MIILVMFLLVSATALTVFVAQQQQTLKQQAYGQCDSAPTCLDPSINPGGVDLQCDGTYDNCSQGLIQCRSTTRDFFNARDCGGDNGWLVCCSPPSSSNPTATPAPAYTCGTGKFAGGGCYDVTTCPYWNPVQLNGTCPTEPYPAICCGGTPPSPTVTPTATPAPAYTCGTGAFAGGECFDGSCPSWKPILLNGTCAPGPTTAFCCKAEQNLTPTSAPVATTCDTTIGESCLNGVSQCTYPYASTSHTCQPVQSGVPIACCKYSNPTPIPTIIPTVLPTTNPPVSCVYPTCCAATPKCDRTGTCLSAAACTSGTKVSFNLQDAPSITGNITATVVIIPHPSSMLQRQITFNETAIFTDTSSPQERYVTYIMLPTAQLENNGKYLVTIKDSNHKMYAKASFVYSTASPQPIIPVTTLVYGDANSDEDINTLDYNALKTCWNGSSRSCSPFGQIATVEQIYYNTWMRGFVTWSSEGL